MISSQLREGGPSIPRIRLESCRVQIKLQRKLHSSFQLPLHSSVNCLDLDNKLSAS